MKRNISAGILGGCLLMLASGCQANTVVTVPAEESTDIVELTEHSQEEKMEEVNYYEELIAAATECILTKNEEIVNEYDFSYVMITSGDYEVLGYLIQDIDGDGVDELLFGANESEPGSAWESVIYDMYTISDGTPVHVFSGSERDRYYLCENGMIANEGSGGAANSFYAYFNFKDSALQFVETVTYDEIKDEENPWFYFTSSDDDSEDAAPISSETAAEIMGKYVYTSLEFIPFAEDN